MWVSDRSFAHGANAPNVSYASSMQSEPIESTEWRHSLDSNIDGCPLVEPALRVSANHKQIGVTDFK